MRLIVALLLALPIPFLAAPQSVAQPQPTAYDHVAACFAERGHLVVLALVDESSSLQNNDPDARRVDALVSMLRTLAKYGATGENKARKIEVQLAGFGTGFTEGPWRELNQSTTGELEAQARGFAERNKKDDTDFAAALLGAQEQFVRKDAEVAQGSRPPCRLLVLFTDGVYDLGTAGQRGYAPGVGGGNFGAIMDAGRRFLCEPGQLADQLRATGTVIVAIGLVPDQPGPKGPPDQSFLQSIAERDGPGQRCGETNTPPGDHVAATGLGELVERVDSAIVRALGGTNLDDEVITKPVCGADAPADQRCSQEFELDASLREFHMLLGLAVPGIAVDLVSPQGTSLRLTNGTTEHAGVGLVVSSLTAVDMVVDGQLPTGTRDWVGKWTVRFVDTTGRHGDAIARAQITLFGALAPVVEPASLEFQAGERTDFTVRVADADGSPRTPADFVRSATVSIELVDPEGRGTPLSAKPDNRGGHGVSHDFPVDNAPSYVDLKVTLDVVTRGGLQLRPRVHTQRVPVKQPSAYPSVTPLELRLSPIIDKGTANGTLTVTGGKGGSGCVWFDSVAFEKTPRDTGKLATTFGPDARSEQGCVRVDAGMNSTVTVRVEPEQVRSGLAEGKITATVKADNEPPRQVRIPVRFEMTRNPNSGVQWLLFIGIMIGGVLGPFLLLWLLSALTTRFSGLDLTRWHALDVVVTPHGVRTDTGRSVFQAVDQRSFAPLPSSVPLRPCTGFEVDRLSFRRQIPLLPWVLPYGRVRADAVALTADRDRVGFVLNHTWVFVVEEATGGEADFRVTGRLFLFLTDFELAQKSARLLGAVEAELPTQVRSQLGRIDITPEPPRVQREVYVPPDKR